MSAAEYLDITARLNELRRDVDALLEGLVARDLVAQELEAKVERLLAAQKAPPRK